MNGQEQTASVHNAHTYRQSLEWLLDRVTIEISLTSDRHTKMRMLDTRDHLLKILYGKQNADGR